MSVEQDKRSQNINDILSVLNHPQRNRIVRLCLKKEMNISDLEKALNLGHGTVQHHIAILKKSNLIHVERKEDVKGRPTMIKTNKAELEKMTDKIERLIKETKYSPIMLDILSFIDSHKATSNEAVLEYIKEKYNSDSQAFVAWGLAEVNSYFGYVLTDKGKSFLKDKK